MGDQEVNGHTVSCLTVHIGMRGLMNIGASSAVKSTGLSPEKILDYNFLFYGT